MKIEQRVREKASLFTPQREIIHITDVKAADAETLFSTLRTLHLNYGWKTKFEVYVEGNDISQSDYLESQDSLNHFLCGYELAMQMNGINVRASWYKQD